MVASYHDGIILSDKDENFQGAMMCFCAKFGYSAPNGLGGVSGQTSKYTGRQLLCIIIRLLFPYCIYAGSKVQNSIDIYSRPQILGSVTFVIIYTKTCHEFYMCSKTTKHGKE